MKTCLLQYFFIGVFLTTMSAIATADDAQNEAIKNDRKQIEGTWRIAELIVNGVPAKEQDARKLNGNDGTWSLLAEGKEINEGTSTFDPLKKPKTIDFTPAIGDGKGKLHLGLYELGGDVRKLCFAPAGKARPTEFSSQPGSGHILVKYERVKSP